MIIITHVSFRKIEGGRYREDQEIFSCNASFDVPGNNGSLEEHLTNELDRQVKDWKTLYPEGLECVITIEGQDEERHTIVKPQEQ